LSSFRVGHARAVAKLRAYYAEAQRRSGIAWQLLAAVNYVESDFGRLREASVAGAQGPMQFMPATWAEYGRGDIHEPRAAILAAARFLRAAGAPRDERAALYRYNPSWAYVDAIRRLAGRIRRDPRAFLVFYARPLVVRTPAGYRRLTGRGRRDGS
jgi:membrane-bound lytic murein transglycosylase B